MVNNLCKWSAVAVFVLSGCGEPPEEIGQTEEPILVDSTGYGLSGANESTAADQKGHFQPAPGNTQLRCAYFSLRGNHDCLVPRLATPKTVFFGAMSVENPRGCPKYASENPELDASMLRVQTLLNNAAAGTGWTFHKTPARANPSGWAAWFDCDENINPSNSNTANAYVVNQLLPISAAGYPKLAPLSSNYYALSDVGGDLAVKSYLDFPDMKSTAIAHGQNWLDYLDHMVMIAVKAGAGFGVIGNHPTYFSSTDMFNPAKKTVVFSPQELCFLKMFDGANPANIFTADSLNCASLQD